MEGDQAKESVIHMLMSFEEIQKRPNTTSAKKTLPRRRNAEKGKDKILGGFGTLRNYVCIKWLRRIFFSLFLLLMKLLLISQRLLRVNFGNCGFFGEALILVFLLNLFLMGGHILLLTA